MNSQSASTVFVLPHYDVYGTAPIGTTRILDVLNDHTTRYLKLNDVRICAPGDPLAMAELASTVLDKNSLQAVLLLGDDRQNESKVFFATLARKTTNVFITLPTIIVEGRIHNKHASDYQTYLSLEATAFFPVTAATVRGPMGIGNRLESPVVLVHKDRVSTISPANE
ncbi:MAG: hypothetical protein ACYC3X_05885 [Pirellulaceae bacterium]